MYTNIPELSNILWFALSALMLVIMPGPAFIYIMTRTAQEGFKTGILSILAIETGTLFHVLSITFGFSFLITKYSFLFIIIKYGGAIYLAYLGVQQLLNSLKNTSNSNKEEKVTSKNIFVDGLILSVFNIKTLIFLLAFLPQFINVSKGDKAIQMFFLGIVFITIALCWGGIMVYIVHRFKKLLDIKIISSKIQNSIVGIIYILLSIISIVSFTN
ncbi:LysE family translocator [Tenacibaculum caenipelagi]|uniref:Threonine/homoserine/homoserine lactone efflux protein n=1 Tax=Tenacibaculum caenipelagi TaxID=1325435 RepID=A0A4R6TEK1_9FLAO|nr:LysE family translocator [Tenacibaculum caenipelagi]TDQ28725.1 threonine/homoserine/homoserine lactone efflux protein [Tenacibaculum caenipelagi]